MIDWRKILPKPDPDAVWCDECLRWESGPGRFPRVRVVPLAAMFFALARAARWPGNRIAERLTDQAERAQVRANIRNGEIHVRLP